VTDQVGGRCPTADARAARGPEPIARLDVARRLDAVAAELRDLDARARATPGIRTLVRSLLATESLSCDQLMALASGARVIAQPGTERRVVRFEQACQEGRRAGSLDGASLQRIHRKIVPGRSDLRPTSDVEPLLEDLAAFLARDDLCPVVQAAIGYAQLLSVRPFEDGNGRLARWLVQVVLRRRGVATALVPPVGLWFAANPAAYLSAHEAYRRGDVDTWCSLVGSALHACAARATAWLRDEGTAPVSRGASVIQYGAVDE
jgi:hypothetical protein